nr:immunoglobulin light chain junction region [Macaca mulatta]MOX74526.1 immunoglobulin light chain junction region [Macaca mulatta]
DYYCCLYYSATWVF